MQFSLFISPEHRADDPMARRLETGCTRIVARIQWLGMRQSMVLRTIELLGERVLPALRRELG